MTAQAQVLAQPQTDWQAVEKVQDYDINGQTGAELYASIGKRGPKAGKNSVGRSIAHTSFTLTWSRRFDKQGGRCTVLAAEPKLAIVYTLPKPVGKLSPPVRESWEAFLAGITKHELVHGQTIKDMTDEAVAATIGLSVPNDPDCRKIRPVMAKLITERLNVQRQRGRDFDRDEMRQGGNVQRLVLNLVNGS
ncbi:DUF922 domain-containing protein [Paraburkholderia aspalathi]|nr:DUF922 domain-containing protein [Paraburkholderia aspalathi]